MTPSTRRRLLVGVVIAAAVLVGGRVASALFADYTWYQALGASPLWSERAGDLLLIYGIGWVIAVLVALIRVYQRLISPLLGPICRFHPSCSEYAEQAVRELGALRGSALAMWRILRCSPLSAGGIDYPPAKARVYESLIHRRGMHPGDVRTAGGPGA